MADYEVSKLMWMAIVIALAASIFTIAKPEIKTAADGVFNKVEEVVKGIDTGDGNNENGGDETDEASYEAARHFLYAPTNAGSWTGMDNNAYDENGNLNSEFEKIIVPENLEGHKVDALDFANSAMNGEHKNGFKGIKKIVANKSTNRVTPLGELGLNWGNLELDLSKSSVTKFDQYTFQGSKNLKKLILPAGITSLGYGVFDKSGIEEITFSEGTGTVPDISYITTIPKGQATLNAPKSMQDQLKSYEGNFKAVNYF